MIPSEYQSFMVYDQMGSQVNTEIIIIYLKKANHNIFWRCNPYNEWRNPHGSKHLRVVGSAIMQEGMGNLSY